MPLLQALNRPLVVPPASLLPRKQYKLFKQLMKRDSADYGHLVRRRAGGDGEAPGSAEGAGDEGGDALSPGGEDDGLGDDRTPNWCGRGVALGEAGEGVNASVRHTPRPTFQTAQTPAPLVLPLPRPAGWRTSAKRRPAARGAAEAGARGAAAAAAGAGSWCTPFL